MQRIKNEPESRASNPPTSTQNVLPFGIGRRCVISARPLARPPRPKRPPPPTLDKEADPTMLLMRQALMCSVCHRLPSSKRVFQCESGHLLCRGCHDDVLDSGHDAFNACPVCGGFLGCTSNPLAEKVIFCNPLFFSSFGTKVPHLFEGPVPASARLHLLCGGMRGGAVRGGRRGGGGVARDPREGVSLPGRPLSRPLMLAGTIREKVFRR